MDQNPKTQIVTIPQDALDRMRDYVCRDAGLVASPAEMLVLPSDNPLDIPVLSLDYQAIDLIAPVLPWGSIKRSAQMFGTYHFYTDDYRFRALWRNPERLFMTGCYCATELNYSLDINTPVAEAVYRTYQKRFVSRFWQSRKIRILVDLNVIPQFRRLNLIGVPQGWTSFSTRGYNANVADIELQYASAKQIAGDAPVLFVVFGGGKIVQEYCRRYGWVYQREYKGGA